MSICFILCMTQLIPINYNMPNDIFYGNVMLNLSLSYNAI